MYFNKSFFGENNVAVEVEIICNKCGKIMNIEDMSFFANIQSEYCVSKKNITCECGNMATPGIIERKKNISLKDATIKSNSYQSNVPKCPICRSTSLSEITAAKKVAKIAAFGIFGMGDNGKTWKCNNCGSKF